MYELAGTSAPTDMPAVPVAPDPPESDYDGPSILSRGNSLPPATKGAMLAFGLYAQIVGVYDSGLMPVFAAAGKPATAIGSYGEETDFGASASHRWRRGKLSLEYRGSYLRYTNAPEFDGLDQFSRSITAKRWCAISRWMSRPRRHHHHRERSVLLLSPRKLRPHRYPHGRAVRQSHQLCAVPSGSDVASYSALVVRLRRRRIRGAKAVPVAGWVERLQCASQRGLSPYAPANDLGPLQ